MWLHAPGSSGQAPGMSRLRAGARLALLLVVVSIPVIGGTTVAAQASSSGFAARTCPGQVTPDFARTHPTAFWRLGQITVHGISCSRAKAALRKFNVMNQKLRRPWSCVHFTRRNGRPAARCRRSGAVIEFSIYY